MSTPCIICVAITGSVGRKEHNPAIPVTIEEQGTFIPATSAMAPAAFDQDPRSDEEVEYEPVVPPDSELEAPLEFTNTEVSGAAA